MLAGDVVLPMATGPRWVIGKMSVGQISRLLARENWVDTDWEKWERKATFGFFSKAVRVFILIQKPPKYPIIHVSHHPYATADSNHETWH